MDRNSLTLIANAIRQQVRVINGLPDVLLSNVPVKVSTQLNDTRGATTQGQSQHAAAKLSIPMEHKGT